MTRLLKLAAWPVVAILLFFTARRWLFMLTALLPDTRPAVAFGSAPDVLLLVPVRNEAETLPQLGSALNNLDYPRASLAVVFINDGSTDESETALRRLTAGRDNWHLCSLAQNAGKASALNAALARFPQGEIIAIYDADERPRPAALRHLAQPFADPQVGGVSGRRAVSNSLASPAASYAAFEGLVHQLVTMRAKDRLRLAPAILGANCAYRRAALEQAGGFKPGALLEDSDLTLKLARAGWQTRFAPQAASYHRVPETVPGYWKQHTRWARGFNEVARAQAGSLLFDPRLSWPLRLELLTFSLGYLDRLALLAGLGLTLLKIRVAGVMVGVTLLTPLLQTMVALKIAGAPAALWRRLVWLPVFFALDIAMAAAGFWDTLRRAPQIWEERKQRQ